MTTIFSKIIDREIPAEIVYEDETVLAFLDVNPVNHGHTLVIPKKPFVNAFDGDGDTLAHMMRIGQKIAIALKESGLAEGVNFIMNNGEEAGQEVFHSHLHVVPRLKDDDAYQTPKHVENPSAKFSEVKVKLIEKLNN